MKGRCHGRHDTRVRVAQDEWTPGANVVEVAVAIDVVEVRPFPAGDEQRVATDRPKRPRRTVDAAGHESGGALEGGLAAGARNCRGHGGGGLRVHGPIGVLETGSKPNLTSNRACS